MKAFELYKIVAENGHDRAQCNLGSFYYKGEGTEKNLEKTFYWYQKAAVNDNVEAQYNLALAYEKFFKKLFIGIKK